MRGTEEGEFEGRVFGHILGFEFFGAQRAIIASVEHRLLVSERVVFGEETHADDSMSRGFRGWFA